MKVSNLLIGVILGVLACTVVIDRTGKLNGKRLFSDGYVDSLTVALDSALVVSSMAPDTIIKDTIIYRDSIRVVYRDSILADTTQKDLNIYRDSILRDDISAWVMIRVRGEMESLTWRYKPVYRKVTETIRIPVPVNIPVPLHQDTGPVNRFTGMAGIGGGPLGAMVSGELIYHLGDRAVGLEAGYYNNRFFQIKYGINF